MKKSISVVVVGLGYAFYFTGNQNQLTAIHLYNDDQKFIKEKEKLSLKIGFTNSGIGLVYNF